MIGKILQGIFSLIIALVNVLLSPIDSLITSALPDLSNALQTVNDLIDYIISVIGFVVDATGLGTGSINLIIAYYTFVLVVPLGISTVKLALRWYNKLKP